LACHLQIGADPDPDPAYHFDADPDPDPNFQFDADPSDPHPQHCFISRVVSKTDVRMHSTNNLHYRQQQKTYVLPTATAAAILQPTGQSAANNGITSTVSSDNQGEQSANTITTRNIIIIKM
jgi:hypothetical protein